MHKLALVLAAVLASCLAATKYTTRFDNVNLDQVLGNERLLNNYVTCLLDDKDTRCSPDAKELKSHIPEALTTRCEGCSDKQRVGAERVIRYLIEKKPDTWHRLEAKYDPSGSYRKTYDAELKKVTASG